MALQKSINFKGLQVSKAYHKILETVINGDLKVATVTLGVFANEAARKEGEKPLNAYKEIIRGKQFDGLFDEVSLSKASMSPLRAGYLALKSLPENAKATDV